MRKLQYCLIIAWMPSITGYAMSRKGFLKKLAQGAATAVVLGPPLVPVVVQAAEEESSSIDGDTKSGLEQIKHDFDAKEDVNSAASGAKEETFSDTVFASNEATAPPQPKTIVDNHPALEVYEHEEVLGSSTTIASSETSEVSKVVDLAQEAKVDQPKPAKMDVAKELKADQPKPPKVESAQEVKVDQPKPVKVEAAQEAKVDQPKPAQVKAEETKPAKVEVPKLDTAPKVQPPSPPSNTAAIEQMVTQSVKQKFGPEATFTPPADVKSFARKVIKEGASISVNGQPVNVKVVETAEGTLKLKLSNPGLKSASDLLDSIISISIDKPKPVALTSKVEGARNTVLRKSGSTVTNEITKNSNDFGVSMKNFWTKPIDENKYRVKWSQGSTSIDRGMTPTDVLAGGSFGLFLAYVAKTVSDTYDPSSSPAYVERQRRQRQRQWEAENQSAVAEVKQMLNSRREQETAANGFPVDATRAEEAMLEAQKRALSAQERQAAMEREERNQRRQQEKMWRVEENRRIEEARQREAFLRDQARREEEARRREKVRLAELARREEQERRAQEAAWRAQSGAYQIQPDRFSAFRSSSLVDEMSQPLRPRQRPVNQNGGRFGQGLKPKPWKPKRPQGNSQREGSKYNQRPYEDQVGQGKDRNGNFYVQ